LYLEGREFMKNKQKVIEKSPNLLNIMMMEEQLRNYTRWQNKDM
jgi:hypothetical protein